MTPLGAKGVAEGSAMSTPVCIANAVADALGVPEISLPLTPEHMLELLRRGSSAPTHRVTARSRRAGPRAGQRISWHGRRYRVLPERG